MKRPNHRGILLTVLLAASVLLFFACPNPGNDTSAENGTVSVTLTNAPNDEPVAAFLYAENEPAINTESKVLAVNYSTVAGGTASFVLEGPAAGWSPNGTTWYGSGGTSYDIYVYTDDNVDTDDEPATTPTSKGTDPFPMTVTIDGNQTVNIDYTDMVDYTGGTVTVEVSGAVAHYNHHLIAAVLTNGTTPGPDVDPLAFYEETIDDSGNASVTVEYPDGGDFYGIDGTIYDIYAFIDINADGTPGRDEPSTGDYLYQGLMPHTYTQSGNETLITTYADDYTLMP